MAKGQRITVIGGGLSGLTSALILARNGHEVTLVERSKRLGLTVRGFSREGVYFDTGLHYTGGLGEDGIVSRYLRYLGLNKLDVVPFLEDGFDEIRFADTGRVVRLPVGYQAMTDALLKQFPEDGPAISTYMAAARADFERSSLLNFFLDMQNAQQSRATTPLAEYLEGLTGNAHLRATLSAHSLLYGVSPRDVSFTQHAYVSASYFDSVHNFVGGGRALVRAMEERLGELDVKVILGNAVRRLVCDQGKRLSRVELADGSMIETDAAVSTVHPFTLADMAGDVFRPSYLEYLRGMRETASAFMLFGIADAAPECLRGRNLFLCRDPDMTKAFTPGAKPEGGPFFVASSPQPPGGNGKAGIVVLAPSSFEDVGAWTDSRKTDRPKAYTEYKESAMRRIHDALKELCPELEAVRFVEGATPLTMRDYLDSHRGGLYGCGHTVHQYNPMPVTRIPNLLLAGQSIIAPGLMGAMISAFLACGFLLGHETLHKEAACS